MKAVYFKICFEDSKKKTGQIVYVGQDTVKPSVSLKEYADHMRSLDTADDISILVWNDAGEVY